MEDYEVKINDAELKQMKFDAKNSLLKDYLRDSIREIEISINNIQNRNLAQCCIECAIQQLEEFQKLL